MHTRTRMSQWTLLRDLYSLCSSFIFVGRAGFLALFFSGMCVGLANAQTITEFGSNIPNGSAVTDITRGPDGNMWFTLYATDRIGRISPNGSVVLFSSGITPGARPMGITAGPDGNMWFTEYAGNRIGRITPTGIVTEFGGLSTGANPNFITAGPDGALWFTEYSAHRIGRISTFGEVTEFVGMTPGAFPGRIISGPDGNLWFTEFSGNRIGRVGVEGNITEFESGISPGAGLKDITVGPDGNLWFTETSGNRIGRITTGGIVTEFSAGISPGAGPVGIVTGSDGNLWFTEYSGNRIGRITPAGVVTEYSTGMTPNANPNYIANGFSADLWFTERAIDRIGKFSFQLSVSVLGTGTGVVTSVPKGIQCPSTCIVSFFSNTNVVLTATPNPGFTFTGWGGSCSGTGSCIVNMATSHNVTATFNATNNNLALHVIKMGTGTGTVSSSPAGVNCGDACSVSFDSGTLVTLTAVPDAGATFTGWSGDCTGTGPCTVNITVTKNVTANFSGTTLYRNLTVSVMGTGVGIIESTPIGLNCEASCAAQFTENTSVALKPTPITGATFAGWSGDCTGTGTCVVTMNTDKKVIGTFKVTPFRVTTTGVIGGVITAAMATVVNTITFNSTDRGKPGSVFVTAIVPATFLGLMGRAPTEVMRMNALEASASTGMVLVQLTPAGWQQVVGGQLLPYASGVLGDQLAAQTILNNTDTSGLLGSQFCVGYGTTAAEMNAAGRMQVVAVVPNPSAQTASSLSCLVTDNLLVQRGWNLLGNSVNQSFPVTNLYSDPTWVSTVWKWDAAQQRWQFFTPGMSASDLLNYVTQKGYGVLSSINPGDGYWVNSTAMVSVSIQSGAAFNLTATNLASGWNLVTTGALATPAAFVTGVAPAGINSMYAWDDTATLYYFYAPSLQAQGGTVLTDYIASHGHLDFTTANRLLTPGSGFWVQKQ